MVRSAADCNDGFRSNPLGISLLLTPEISLSNPPFFFFFSFLGDIIIPSPRNPSKPRGAPGPASSSINKGAKSLRDAK